MTTKARVLVTGARLVGLLGFLPGITIHFGGLEVAGQHYTADNWLHTALGAGMVACGLLRG